MPVGHQQLMTSTLLVLECQNLRYTGPYDVGNAALYFHQLFT